MINNERSAIEKLCFIFRGSALLLTNTGEIPKNNQLAIQNLPFARMLSFDFTASPHLVAELAGNTILPAGMQLIDLNLLFSSASPEIIQLAGKARQLIEWDKSHQFCGECGAQTSIASHEHSRTCNHCQRIFYPRISPVIIVAVEREKEILLARSPHFPANIYSVLAGFVESGESVEQAVHREVLEETGITICNLRYFKSQPWPFPNSLMLGFQADYASGNIICAANEIEDAAFFHVDELPKTFSGRDTISQWLIKDFYQRHKFSNSD